MEKNYFNRAYMYIIGIFAIGIAISNVISFFNGVGFAFIATSILLFLAISNILKSDKKKRFGDLFIFIAIEVMLLIVLFFAYDFSLEGVTNKFPLVMRNICAIYSIFAVAYVLFRYVSEINGKKYKFVEYMLGNYIPQPKEKKVKRSKEEIKKNKELENGTLEPKPSSVESVATTEADTEEDTAEEQNLQEENAEVENAEEKQAEEPKQEQSNQQNNNNYNNNRPYFW